MGEPLYLGIDGGQSGTRAIIATAQGDVLASGNGPACDHITGPQGEERNRAAIHGAIHAAVAAGKLNPAEIVAVGMALTSAPREINAQPIFTRIVHEVLYPAKLWIDHDVAGNLAGASAGAPGVVVIAGGGSISYGTNEQGKEGKAGGLGYLMGDDGSAWWIGLHGLRAAARAVDGRGPATALVDRVLDHYQIPTIRHIVAVLYGPEFRRDQVAAFSREVALLAETDVVAAGIITTAAELLAGLALATIRQIHAAGEEVDVYPTGGVFQAGPLLNDTFARVLTGGWPEAHIRTPQFDPVVGALFRAWQAAGVEITPAMLERIRETSKPRLVP